MFYQKLVDPFLEPFRDWFVVKVTLFTSAVFAQVSGFWELFNTEWGYVWLLGALMILDAVGKTIDVTLTKGSEEWDFDMFIRKSLYKATSYIVVLTAFVMFSNQFDGDSSRIEYGAYLGLSLLELFSIAGHFKLIGYAVAVAKQVATGKIDFQQLKEEADKYNVKRAGGKSNG